MIVTTPSPSPLRRRIAAAAIAAGLLATAAAPAQADSIAYLKDGDIHLSTTDGSRQYQVTSGGGYSSVSQADDGRIVALRGDRIRQLDRQGTVLSEIVTPVSTTADPSMAFRGPFDPVVSPDGRKVAYSYYWQYTGYDPYCNPSTNCTVKRLYHGTGFTATDRVTAWDEPGFLRRSGWKDAHWLDDHQVLLSDPYILPNEDVVLWSPEDPDSLKRWFVDHAYYGDVTDSAMSRDRSALATVTKGGRRMSISRAVGLFHPQYPVRCFEASVEDEGEAARISSPTFNATGSRVFWATPKGISAATLPTFTTDSCGTLTDGGGVLVPGATAPAWGPADVPAPRQTPPPGGGGTPVPGPAPGPVPAPPTPAPAPAPGPGAGQGGTGGAVAPTPSAPVGARTALSVPRTPLATALRAGLRVRLTGMAAGPATVRATAGGRTIGRGRATVGASGRATVLVRFTAAARRTLGRRASATVTLRAGAARTTVTLRRG
ncbi:hypothetical protein GKE82_11060 [Conexibacter sp. W3-3-2]|uniref:hypothetical protein n=1 Tax=Conexibacter sp. W3-3-2 TaxID=2675227 RepID=UPI0012B95A4E|nr:hypothetical protein [Conexibacter sp. W3-3-2]MTD44814.1 hypothetical protein [Conexibacter sp. W3-3-2]